MWFSNQEYEGRDRHTLIARLRGFMVHGMNTTASTRTHGERGAEQQQLRGEREREEGSII